jgi:hypothetical protein
MLGGAASGAGGIILGKHPMSTISDKTDELFTAATLSDDGLRLQA